MSDVLVIGGARPDVLRDWRRLRPAPRATVLGRRTPAVDVTAWIEPPMGPLAWRRLDPAARAALRATRWSEIVILHNLGDDSYADIIALARRAGPRVPLSVYYADGVTARYHSALTLTARRGLRAVAASALLGLLTLAALPVAARARRS